MSGVRSSRSFRALAFDFVVACEEGALLTYLEHVLSGLPAGGDAPSCYSIAPMSTVPGARFVLSLDGEIVTDQERPESLVGAVVHDLNRRAVDSWPGVVLHAGGVTRDGIGLVLPAHMESGKSTLTAGLVRAGFDYLSDEAIALAPAARPEAPGGFAPIVCPYPKPLSLDPGSWPLFPELEPRAALDSDSYRAGQWQVPPGAIRPNSVAVGGPIRAVVFPRYVERAETTLEPMRRGEALVELAKNTFRFNEQPRRSLDVLAQLVRGARPYRLTTGGLAAAVEVVTRLHTDLARETVGHA